MSSFQFMSALLPILNEAAHIVVTKLETGLVCKLGLDLTLGDFIFNLRLVAEKQKDW